jgi:hypothetical protein
VLLGPQHGSQPLKLWFASRLDAAKPFRYSCRPAPKVLFLAPIAAGIEPGLAAWKDDAIFDV